MQTGKPGEGDSAAPQGSFQRRPTAFHDVISTEAGARFAPEAGRYHLYVSHACPWAHRTLITRALKGLEHVIDVSVVNWYLDFGRGWSFDEGEGVVVDPNEHVGVMRELYQIASSNYAGSITVPVLWDKTERTIVNNESSEIIRMLDGAFQDYAKRPELVLSPSELLGVIDEVNGPIYDAVNNGVYKAGFARSQEAYDHAVNALFDRLDALEDRLSNQRWLVGDRFTEADVRLFTTLIRFDPVYNTHFKCSRRRIADYPNLWAYTREIAQVPEVRATIHLDHIRNHYYVSHAGVNPRRIVAAMPATYDLDAPHDRARLGGHPVLPTA
ncbi:MAG: glutathione S-transferase C-terminal domain-containing protein [Myxococcota bacterium]